MKQEVWYAVFDEQTLSLTDYNYFTGADRFFRPMVIPQGVDPSTTDFGIPAVGGIIIEQARFSIIGAAGARQIFLEDYGFIGAEDHFGFQVTEAVSSSEEFGFIRQTAYEEWQDLNFLSRVKAAPAGPRRISSHNTTAFSGRFKFDAGHVDPIYVGSPIRLQVELLVTYAGQAVVVAP